MYSSTDIPSSEFPFFLFRRCLKTVPGFCVWVLYAYFFWANFQRVPGQDKLLGNRLGFNSRDHMDECQNQLSVTCSASLGEFGKGKAGGWKEAVNCKIK